MAVDRGFLDALKVEKIHSALDLSGFNCDPAIDWFLREAAADHHARRITSVTCWSSDGRLAGYLATSMTVVTIDDSPLRELLRLAGITFMKDGGHVKRFPGYLIGMLGVCSTFRRRGLGVHMVKYAIGEARQLSKRVGCRIVTVDSDRTAEALGLYRSAGFSGSLKPNPTRAKEWMYFDLGSVQPSEHSSEHPK